VLDLGDGMQGIVAVETKYHERTKPEAPKPSRLPCYLEITETSGVFAPDAIDAVNETDLLQIWLDHLLVLSMLQHPSGTWHPGRAHPAGRGGIGTTAQPQRSSDVLWINGCRSSHWESKAKTW
jgi:hypothetical protein